MNFGDKVKEVRKRKGISQLELGEKMNISQQAIAKYEKTVEQPKMSTVRKIAEALGVTISEIIDWGSVSREDFEKDLFDTHGTKALTKQIETEQRILKEVLTVKPKLVQSEGEPILDLFHCLNDTGQDKAIEQVELLTKIPEYQKDEEQR